MIDDSYLKELADPAKPLAASKLTELSAMGPEEVSSFLSTWLEMAPDRRQRLIQILIDLGEDSVELDFAAVFFIALGDGEAEVRRGAVTGLWEHDGRDLIDPLVGLLQSDPEAGVRAEAALALGRFVLQAEFDTLRATDAERVEQVLRRTVDDLAEVVEVRGRALESLGASSEPWVSDLIQEALESAERRLRLSAVHAMGRSCSAEWLPALIAELESDDPEMRFEAATACGVIAEGEATQHLALLLRDDDDEVRQAAIVSLGQIGGPQAKETLEELVEEGDEGIQEAAIAALAEVDFAEDPIGFKVRD
ncbi:MAG: HEAT repeat domain-containing protein [Chloroflexi bacterium]|nr:HEAT repeat domain-containing protein [Chloroflexota bacterium]